MDSIRTFVYSRSKWPHKLRADAHPGARERFLAAPGGVPTQEAFSQSRQWPALDTDRAGGCIRDLEHAYSRDGGLAVLYGNIAPEGCIVKTAGIDESMFEAEAEALR
jgi:dihydroxy-acid dehydratase